MKNDDFIYLNGNQIFHQDLMIDFDHHLIHNRVSFEGYTAAYNAKIRSLKERESRQLKFVSHEHDRM